MKLIPNKINRNLATKMLQAKKNSPHIFFAAGVVGVVGGAVLACRATLKLEKTLDEINDDVENAQGMAEVVSNGNVTYDEKDHYKDLVYVYGKAGAKLVRLYGPSIVVGGLGIASLTGAHVQLARRNAALAATLGALHRAYDEYRARVREELGEERELEVYRGISDRDYGVDEKNKKIKAKVFDPNALSPYARIFDELSPNWEKDNELNRLFIQHQQNYFNHRLHAKGYVFLNDVYEALGFERSKAGQIVGWKLDGDGDGHVDFGLFEATNSRFINGLERSVVLDFNVDGNIYEEF